jgi:hypothetical protein
MGAAWRTAAGELRRSDEGLGAVLGPDAGEGEQWPILIQREPDDVLLGLRVRLRRVFSEAVGRDQASVLRL